MIFVSIDNSKQEFVQDVLTDTTLDQTNTVLRLAINVEHGMLKLEHAQDVMTDINSKMVDVSFQIFIVKYVHKFMDVLNVKTDIT